jgi:hypothetical protein
LGQDFVSYGKTILAWVFFSRRFVALAGSHPGLLGVIVENSTCSLGWSMVTRVDDQPEASKPRAESPTRWKGADRFLGLKYRGTAADA